MDIIEFSRQCLPPAILRAYNEQVLYSNDFGTWQYFFSQAVEQDDESILNQITGESSDTMTWLKYNWAVLVNAFTDPYETVSNFDDDGCVYTYTVKTFQSANFPTWKEQSSWMTGAYQKAIEKYNVTIFNEPKPIYQPLKKVV